MILVAASVTAILFQPPPKPDLSYQACPAALALLAIGEDHEASLTELRRLDRHAVGTLHDVLGGARIEPATAAPFIELLTMTGDSTSQESIRQYMFATEPEIGALAIRALVLTSGPRAVPTLEFILRSQPRFEQAQAAIEGLESYAYPSSFQTLASFAETEGNDPILRARAADLLPDLNVRKTKRWLSKLALPATVSPLFRARIETLSSSLKKRRRN